VSVVDSFEQTVEATRVALIDENGHSINVVKQNDLFEAKAPPGPCTLTVEASGFQRLIKQLVLPAKPVFLQAGLLLAQIGDPVEALVTWNGRVSQCPGKGNAWVRLSGLYAEVVYQAHVARDCSFSFSALTAGEFIAYVVADGRVLAAKPVRVVVGITGLLI
jgi:hypothetical protein